MYELYAGPYLARKEVSENNRLAGRILKIFIVTKITNVIKNTDKNTALMAVMYHGGLLIKN